MFQRKNIADHSGHSTLHQSESSVRKISLPVKIVELIGSCKKLQNGQSKTNRHGKLPISQPVKIAELIGSYKKSQNGQSNRLSTTNITNKEINNNDIDSKIMEQKPENLNNNIKIINNVNTKSLCAISNNINTEDSNSPKEVYKTSDTNLMKFVETDVSPTKYTPVLNKYKDKKVERPLKEYMALKSQLKCLLTPNINRFNCSQSKNDNLFSETSDAKTSLSRKILAQLYNLYED